MVYFKIQIEIFLQRSQKKVGWIREGQTKEEREREREREREGEEEEKKKVIFLLESSYRSWNLHL